MKDDVIGTHRRNGLYSHQRSIEQRRPPRPPNEVDHVSQAWRDKEIEVGQQCRRSFEEVERRIRQDIAGDVQYHAGQGQRAHDQWRQEVRDQNAEKRAAVDQHFKPKLEEAVRRNPRE